MSWPQRLLHLETDAAFLGVVDEALLPLRVTIQQVCDAQQWQAAAAGLDIDLVLIEADAPPALAMSVVETARQAADDRRIIAFARQADPERWQLYRELGADYFFLKSQFQPAELLEVLSAMRRQWALWQRAWVDCSSADELAGRSIRFAHDDNQAFSRWLAAAGRLTPEALAEALDYCDRMAPKLGQIALAHGLLSMKQIFCTLQQQAVSGEFFGEAAVRLGYLAADDLRQLLHEQASYRPLLDDALVALGIVNTEQLAELRAEFAARQWPAAPSAVTGPGALADAGPAVSTPRAR